ncbi:MAG: ABC transporter ATP-binding protein [Nannocystales bacterium]
MAGTRHPSSTMQMPATLFELRGLCKAFDADVPLLRDANLTVYEGETLAIIGESGCGKSVLLKMMMGLMEPDAGEILFRGKSVYDMNLEELGVMRKQVGYVFQNDALFDSMSVLDNIGYGMREHTKADDKEILDRAQDCLEFVGLERWRVKLYPAELSGGQRKRVGIARAIAMKPKMLLYDEPTQGLDPQSITRIANLIIRLRAELRATSVVVTHDMRTAFTAANRIALLHDARFDYVGSPAQFAYHDAEPVKEFIADALEEIQELPFLQAPGVTLPAPG